jgi:hypothetical protein
MKLLLKAQFFLLSAFIVVSGSSHATNVQIGPVYISSLAIVGTSAYGHIPGSLEISTSTPPILPTALSCQYDYISTKNTIPGFKEMVTVLLAAELAQKPVLLNITDDASQAAYGPRCSILGVTILK